MKILDSVYFSDIVALLALLIASWSLFYSFFLNRYGIEVSDTYSKCKDDWDELVSFKISNTGNRPVTIKNVALLNNKGKKIYDTGFDPYAYYKSQGRIPLYGETLKYSRPFNGKELLLPNQTVKFNYYLNEKPEKISVICNKRIRFLKKTKVFSVEF